MATKILDRKATPRRARSRIPTFNTIDEAAEFWDTHSIADYLDELEVIDDDEPLILIRAQKKLPMTVRLEPDILTLLTQEARSQGVGPSTMARMAILKYLKDTGRGTIIRGKQAPKRKNGRKNGRKKSKGAA